MQLVKDRRASARMEKCFQVFSVIENKKSVDATFDICDKGVGLLTNLNLNPGDSIETQIFPTDEFFSITCAGTVVHVREVGRKNGFRYKAGIRFLEGLKDFAAGCLVGESEQVWAKTQMVINASQKDCYDAISNYESYPSWQKNVKSVKTHEYDSEGRPEIVELNFDFIFKKITVVNKYEYYDKDYILSWKTLRGDIKAHEASYAFQKIRDNRTIALLSGYMIAGFYIPKRILDYLNNITVRNSVKALKNIVESGQLNFH